MLRGPTRAQRPPTSTLPRSWPAPSSCAPYGRPAAATSRPPRSRSARSRSARSCGHRRSVNRVRCRRSAPGGDRPPWTAAPAGRGTGRALSSWMINILWLAQASREATTGRVMYPAIQDGQPTTRARSAGPGWARHPGARGACGADHGRSVW